MPPQCLRITTTGSLQGVQVPSRTPACDGFLSPTHSLQVRTSNPEETNRQVLLLDAKHMLGAIMPSLDDDAVDWNGTIQVASDSGKRKTK